MESGAEPGVRLELLFLLRLFAPHLLNRHLLGHVRRLIGKSFDVELDPCAIQAWTHFEHLLQNVSNWVFLKRLVLSLSQGNVY